MFTRSLRRQVEARFRAENLAVAEATRGFDWSSWETRCVIRPAMVGRSVSGESQYGIKNMLYRNLKTHPHTRYQIFVEGDYRAERIRQAGVEGISTVHKVGMTKFDPLFWPNFPKRATILSGLGLTLTSRRCCLPPPINRRVLISCGNRS